MVSSRRRLQQGLLVVLVVCGTLGFSRAWLAVHRVLEAAVAEPPTVDLGEALLEVVAERTGYPADMLSFEADLEGDLGIDSIKRVEIIAAYRRSVLRDREEPPAWFMERMTAARTMAEILVGVRALVEGGG